MVYEDDDVIVVNKPKGLVVHPAPGHPDGTLVNALLYHCGDSLSGINGELRPGIVHRIDRDTSGLIIAAKNDFAHVRLAAQLQDHTLARTYRCIVTGNLREDSRHGKCPHRPLPGRSEEDGGGGRGTECRDPLAGAGTVSRRGLCGVPSGNRAHPPDPGAYGPHRPSHSGGHGVRQQKAGTRPARASASTPWGCGFLHPRTGAPVELTCPLPEEFQRQLEKYRRMARWALR